MTIIKSRNGYTGMLRGDSELTVFDALGNKVLHAEFSNIRTDKELRKFVDDFPTFVRELLSKEVCE